MNSVKDELLSWHERFAACVRAGDFHGGRALFAPDCKSFGTCAGFAASREDLMQQQWQRVWPATRHFHFLREPFEIILSGDNKLACVLAFWESEGITPDDVVFPRRGRCTTILRREGNGGNWLAMHTHYSKMPDGSL
jgi:ketosteroid isomerase-like protein